MVKYLRVALRTDEQTVPGDVEGRRGGKWPWRRRRTERLGSRALPPLSGWLFPPEPTSAPVRRSSSAPRPPSTVQRNIRCRNVQVINVSDYEPGRWHTLPACEEVTGFTARRREVGVCSTRGGCWWMYITFASVKKWIRQNPLWLWNPDKMSPIQGNQWPQKKDMCPLKTC